MSDNLLTIGSTPGWDNIMNCFLQSATASSHHMCLLTFLSAHALQCQRMLMLSSSKVWPDMCRKVRGVFILPYVRMSKTSKRGRWKGEYSRLLCHYQSLVIVIMKQQAAVIWKPLTLSAHLISLVTGAEEWECERCSATPLLSQQDYPNLSNISQFIINATSQMSLNSQSYNS